MLHESSPRAASLTGSRTTLHAGAHAPFPYREDHELSDRENDGLENRIKGGANQVKGRVRNAVGGVTGDSSEQIKGKAQELKGKAQSELGKIQTELDDDTKRKR